MPELRPAVPADIPAIVALHERCWRISYAGLADADAKFARPYPEWERIWLSILPDTRVAVVDGAVAGFVVLRASRDADAPEGTGEIQALYVDPDAQGRGAGAALLARAAAELAAAGFTRVTLWTFAHTPSSRGFYERLGFAWDGTATRDGDGPIVRYARALDPFGGRRPTSHERMTGVPWDASYHAGPAPWDVGGPQRAVVRAAAAGGFAGPVLDAGCGSGANALHLAALGLEVVGVDVAETALAIARADAAARGLPARFEAADALQLQQPGRTFRTVLDSGLLHTFDAEERARYAASLAAVARDGATLYVLCFSDEGAQAGPHPVSRAELEAAFGAGSGWEVLAIEPDRVQTRFHDDGAPAWWATLRRAGPVSA